MLKRLCTFSALTTLFGSTPTAAAPPRAELGGRVHTRAGPFVLGVPADIRVYNDGLCVAGAKTSDGWYALSLEPGRYWLQVLGGSEEVAAQQVDVTAPGSWQRDIETPFPIVEAPPEVVKGQRPGPATSRS